MKISIVVPTYNEAHDIRGTLDALLALAYDDKEILIVDDSTDETPAIVREYADRGVTLIHPGGGGRCEARNLGIMQATGEVVVILNADVRPPADFLQRIAPHYAAGVDYLLVEARVSNLEDLFARYVACQHAHDHQDPNKLEWTEGFSCRRDLAIQAGLFPVGFPVKICAGEDGYFGTNLRALGVQKGVDFTIVVDHVAPAAFGEYWHIRKGRGTGSAQVHRLLHGWSHGRTLVWNLLKWLRLAIWVGLVVPPLWHCAKLARYSPRGLRDTLPFAYAWLVEQLAFQAGDWKSLWQVQRRIKETGWQPG